MLGGDTSRRGFLKKGLSTSLATLAVGPATATTLPNVVEIRSDGGGLAGYEFTVSGRVEQVDSGDDVAGPRASGHVGPVRGTDTFRYSGHLYGLDVAGPATAYQNGDRIDAESLGSPSGSIQRDDFDSGAGTNVLRIHGGGGAPTVYEFAVSGSLRQRDSGDRIDGNRAVGHVGPVRGVDTFAFTGDVTDFRLAGPANVTLNGNRVEPGRGPVEFLDCNTARVHGSWKRVVLQVKFYPPGAELWTTGPVEGTTTIRPPKDEIGGETGYVVAHAELYRTMDQFSDRNPAVTVRNPRTDECLASIESDT